MTHDRFIGNTGTPCKFRFQSKWLQSRLCANLHASHMHCVQTIVAILTSNMKGKRGLWSRSWWHLRLGHVKNTIPNV